MYVFFLCVFMCFTRSVKIAKERERERERERKREREREREREFY